MVRSLYSGVAGMISHQGKMDVVGNNISNVSTHGYKHSRYTFRDVYYQTSSSAAAATPTSGGVNPRQIGYGAKMGSVDVNHGQSVMSTTGYTLDVAIAGDGYLQVMDGDGNMFYTKAGMLDIDSEGNVVDVNGNFVLGVSGNPAGQSPSSNKIKIQLPYENASVASVTDIINEVEFTIESSEESDAGNVNIVFAASNKLPIGQKAVAEVTSSSIVVTLNSKEIFDNIGELNVEMNNAIRSANGGINHPGGIFSVRSTKPSAFPAGGLTGAEIVQADFGVNSGSVTLPKTLANYFTVMSVGDDFDPGEEEEIGFAVTFTPAEASDDEEEPGTEATLTVTLGDYTRTISGSQLKSGGTLLLQKPDGSTTDSVVISYPNADVLEAALKAGDLEEGGMAKVKPSTPSNNIGLGQGNFLLKGGTEGGEQGVSDLTGISINDKGVITGTHATLGLLELGRIDLATFDNPAGLSQAGNTYFQKSLNSGEPILAIAGSDGTGNILGGTLETSNTDLSQEMSDMITTQRGFQACSRLITVSDTMLEELINLKR